MSWKPRLLDLFCGAGGAARGYQRAGFYVVGVDVKPQPRYAGDEFIQADAIACLDAISFPNSGYDAIHASPPCQAYSALHGLVTKDYARLVDETRHRLREADVPWVIENVVGAPLINPIRLCGSSFGLGVWRHRLFEMDEPPALVPTCSHYHHPKPLDVTGTGGPSTKPRTSPGGGLSRKPRNLAEAGAAMGIDWMTRPELAEAIPPAMTEWIGRALLQEIESRAA